MGQPSLQKLLDFADEMSAERPRPERRALVDQWRAGNDRYYKLEKAEAGEADKIEVRALDKPLRRLAATVKASAQFRRVFNVLPTRFAMVELDRLIVTQPHVNIDYARRLQAEIGARPSPEKVFRSCMQVGRQAPPVESRQTGSSRFLFWSASSDLRFHEAALLRADQLRNYDGAGPFGASVGLMVGYGSNYLSVIQSDNRCIIHDGHHRAYALRVMGLTHAPCVIQTVTRLAELGLAASRSVTDAPEFYFRNPRPPLLKDFFDRKIVKILKIQKILRMVEVSFEVRDFEVKDFGMAG